MIAVCATTGARCAIVTGARCATSPTAGAWLRPGLVPKASAATISAAVLAPVKPPSSSWPRRPARRRGSTSIATGASIRCAGRLVRLLVLASTARAKRGSGATLNAPPIAASARR